MKKQEESCKGFGFGCLAFSFSLSSVKVRKMCTFQKKKPSIYISRMYYFYFFYNTKESVKWVSWENTHTCLDWTLLQQELLLPFFFLGFSLWFSLCSESYFLPTFWPEKWTFIDYIRKKIKEFFFFLLGWKRWKNYKKVPCIKIIKFWCWNKEGNHSKIIL